VRLPRKLEFARDWVVGLSAIHLPINWNTLGTWTDQFIGVNWTSGKTNFPFPLPRFSAGSTDHLLRVLHNALHTFKNAGDGPFERLVKDAPNLIHFSYNTDTARFSVQFDSKIRSIELTKQLAYMLGFRSTLIENNTTADFAPDLTGGLHFIYVYAPGLIEPVHVGDVSAPILRIFSVSRATSNSFTELVFDRIEFHRLLSKEISEVKIELRSASGELIPFQYGSCLLTLTFSRLSML
jgi:hypothetical protein